MTAGTDSQSYDRVYVDATVLATLASTDDVDLLPAVFTNPRTSYAVQSELEDGVDAGFTALSNALEWLRDPLDAEPTEAGPPGIAVAGSLVHQRKPELMTRLAPSEATVLYQALATGVPLATDDCDVRAVAASYQVPVTGSLGVLARAVESGERSVDEADAALATWRDAGYGAPITTISELLNDDRN